MFRLNCPPLASLCLAFVPLPSDLLVPEQFPTIQAAVDNAQDGDTVDIAPGIYFENLVIPELEILILGRAGNSATIIDGSGAGSVIAFDWSQSATGQATLELDGLTLQGGDALLGGGIFGRGRITFEPHAASLSISNCVIRDCRAENGGGGLFLTYFHPIRITNSVISDNVVYGTSPFVHKGGGLSVTGFGIGGSDGILNHCTIVNNQILHTQGLGAGVHQVFNPFLTRNCIIYGNTIAGSPNSIGFSGSVLPPVENSCFEGSQVHDWGLGNIPNSPRFVSNTQSDYHLRHNSPCIDSGVCGGTGTIADDYEGDARPNGSCSDMGADEWAPHLYHTEATAPGSDLRLRMTALNPGDLVTIWIDRELLSTPRVLPFGTWYLNSRNFAAAVNRSVPASGTLTVNVSLPAALPSGLPIYAQALAAGLLSNLDPALVP